MQAGGGGGGPVGVGVPGGSGSADLHLPVRSRMRSQESGLGGEEEDEEGGRWEGRRGSSFEAHPQKILDCVSKVRDEVYPKNLQRREEVATAVLQALSSQAGVARMQTGASATGAATSRMVLRGS
uniref:Uncharacterized protein n=1 Tax=Chromera velia CCMP2878 TaxID=1169474 RepID=A0A0G4HXT0_9ALVE|eukprot:Cvel_33291.t1-p1 / transcript=Cvel_33291.t1 / gene=Cvel_33291 / organism=Chromera_velia_CCMP2878 / gene_product=hypothetical protein / transcript_product=hypothetical protein / location=Cvel_scaffold5367:1206-1985(-) / protein_length=124 / sequence_SO=supercontig / SO=protein_coding / is_pseudo=false